VNLNHILLFLAVISSLLVLAQGWRPTAQYHGWRVPALIVLAISGVAWLFWRGAAGYIASGAWFLLLFTPAVGLRKMTELAADRNYKLAIKLGAALQILHPSSELREQIQLLRNVESRANRGTVFVPGPLQQATVSRTRYIQLRSAPAVLILILLNVVTYLFELSAGDWNDPEVLHRIGAIDTYSVVARHEYWRFLTALFLHGGLLHLGFNVFALYLLGPPLERSVGTVRFVICYLISGIASGAGVIGLTLMGFVQPAQLIGASGAIMGIVGAWAGFLLRHRHAPNAKQRLGNVMMIVVIQIAFDLSTPQVSMAAHMCGLIAGFVLGLLLAPSAVAGRT